MNRREFLEKIGKGLLFTSSVSLAGCSSLFNSASDKPPVLKEIKETPRLQKTKKAEETEKSELSLPDLVVITGKDPALNVKTAMEKMGSMSRFVKKGDRVIVKPNILTARKPEFAVTTNPFLVGAIVSLCYEAGASEVTVLDYPTSSPSIAYETSGIAEETKKAGGKIKILTERNFENTLIPQGRVLKQWPLVKDIFEANVLINVPIAKTHGLAILTMAMKNLMGIMGDPRGKIHIDFDQKIVDLNTLVKPHLVVLDAHRILIRNGPTGGSLDDVRTVNKLVVGTNQVAVDAYGATLFGMEPTNLPFLVKAHEQGLGEIDLDKLRITELSI